METDEYIREEITIEASSANLKALTLMLPIGAMASIPYYMIWKHTFTVGSIKTFRENNEHLMAYGTLIALLVIVVGIVLHELIHGITWSIFAKQGFRSIKFGVLWKELTPYCHCSEPLCLRHYILGTVMPAIILGILPTFLAYLSGNIFLMAFGLFFSLSAAGDFMMINLLRKEDADTLIQDHPSKIGCFVFRKAPAANKNA